VAVAWSTLDAIAVADGGARADEPVGAWRRAERRGASRLGSSSADDFRLGIAAKEGG